MTEQMGPQCLNPLPHEPHRWLADADAVTLSACRGRNASLKSGSKADGTEGVQR